MTTLLQIRKPKNNQVLSRTEFLEELEFEEWVNKGTRKGYIIPQETSLSLITASYISDPKRTINLIVPKELDMIVVYNFYCKHNLMGLSENSPSPSFKILNVRDVKEDDLQLIAPAMKVILFNLQKFL